MCAAAPCALSRRDGGRVARGGLGVGPSLAKSIVEMHGGTIEARSDGTNLGSELIVRLPTLASERVAEPVRAPTRGPRRRIVLVEDQCSWTSSCIARRRGAASGLRART
jgi:hypothetical protein